MERLSENSDALSDTARVRGNNKRQLVALARIRLIAVCLLCVRGIPPTVEAARTGQSTTAKIQAHPSYPQVKTELTKSSGPKGKMAPGNLVLPKNALHSGVRRGTSHFPAGAAHRCIAGPRPPITLVRCATGKPGRVNPPALGPTRYALRCRRLQGAGDTCYATEADLWKCT